MTIQEYDSKPDPTVVRIKNQRKALRDLNAAYRRLLSDFTRLREKVANHRGHGKFHVTVHVDGKLVSADQLVIQSGTTWSRLDDGRRINVAITYLGEAPNGE